MCEEKCKEHGAICGNDHTVGKLHSHRYNSDAPPRSIYGEQMQFLHSWHVGDRVNAIYAWGTKNSSLPYYKEPDGKFSTLHVE